MTRKENFASRSAWRSNHGPRSDILSVLMGEMRLVTVAVAVVHSTKQMTADTLTPQAKPTLTNRYWSRIGYTVPPIRSGQSQSCAVEVGVPSETDLYRILPSQFRAPLHGIC